MTTLSGQDVEDIYELTPMQAGMLYHTLAAPGSGVYVQQVSCRLAGDLDAAVFAQAWRQTIARHPVLRTAIVWEGLDEPQQVVFREVALPLEQLDWRGQPASEQDAALEMLLSNERARGFDLTAAPLLRLKIIRLADNVYELVWSRQHIILDGWSVALVLKEALTAYASLSQGASPRAEPPRPYGDYVAWLRGQDLKRAEAHWRETLQGFHAATQLGVARNETDAGGVLGAVAEETLHLSTTLTEQLQTLVRGQQLTLSTLLQAAWGVLLSRYSGDEDVMLGAAVSGRPATLAGVEQMVGLFINTLPVRVRVTGEGRIGEWLRDLQRESAAAREYEYSPLVAVQGWSEVPRGQPLFESLLAVENFPMEDVLHGEVGGLTVRGVRAFERTNFPLTVFAVPGPELSLRIAYDTRRFERQTVARMLAHLQAVLETIVVQPDAPLATLTAAVPLQTLNVVVASTFTSGSLEEALTFWFDRLDVPARLHFAPYSQVFQELLDPASRLGRNHEGVNVILLRLEDWMHGHAHTDAAAFLTLEENLRDFLNALETFRTYNQSPCLIGVCPMSNRSAEDTTSAGSLRRLEMRLAQRARALSGVHALDSLDLARRYAVRDVNDPDADEIGHVPYTAEYFAALGTALVRKIYALTDPGHAVVVLDCDQTLWYGVSGEDEPDDIQLPSPYYVLQEFMVRQHKAGRLLCLSSKNREADVFNVFRHHPEMPLALKHFVSWRMNWESASANLESLAAELRLPLTRVIYVSGNPAECAEVRAGCPSALVVQLPDDAAVIPEYLDHVWAFDRVS